MVQMFMRHDDSIKIFGVDTYGGQTALGLPPTEAGIYEQTNPLGGKVNAVAPRPTR